MKELISRNWMKIMRICGYICIALILVKKYTAEKTLIADYAKYGKDVSSNGEASGIISNGVDSFVSGFTGVNPELVKYALLFIVLISLVVLINTLLDRKSDTKKK